jgi:hypothetical protein
MTDKLIENSQQWTAEWAAIARERDELRAEVEQLRALKAGTVTVALANGLFGSDKYVPERHAKTLEAEVERLRAALVQIENWVGKEYRDLTEAETIREYIDKACSVLDKT